MTTTPSNTDSTHLGRPGKVLISVFITLIIALLAWSSVGNANADPVVTVKAGDMIHDSSVNVGGVQLPTGGCSGVPFTDKNTRKGYMLTMGHCSEVGHVISKNGTIPIGRMKHVVFNATSLSTSNKLDIGIVELKPNVRINPSGLRIGTPVVNQPIHKRGHGLWTPEEAYGQVTHVYRTDFRVNVQCSPFDSGGLITDGSGNVLGLISRGWKDYTSADTAVMRTDVARDIIERRFGIVMGDL